MAKLLINIALVVMLVAFVPQSLASEKYPWQCKPYDLSDFVFAQSHKYLVLFNVSECVAANCSLNFSLLSGLFHRFKVNNFTELQFVYVANVQKDTEEFNKIRNKTGGHIPLMSVGDLKLNQDDYFTKSRVLVFDQCSRLTYKFTSLKQPNRKKSPRTVHDTQRFFLQLIKAAILATILDSPCGECEQVTASKESDYYDYGSYAEKSSEQEASPSPATSTTTQPIAETAQNVFLEAFSEQNGLDSDTAGTADDSYIVPLRVIYPIEHVHRDSSTNEYEKYNYIVLKTGDSKFHSHLATDQLETFKKVDSVQEITSNVLNKLNEAAKTPRVIPIYRYVNSEGLPYKVTREYYSRQSAGNGSDGSALLTYEEVAPVYEYREIAPEPEANTNDDDSLLSSLQPWLPYTLVTEKKTSP